MGRRPGRPLVSNPGERHQKQLRSVREHEVHAVVEFQDDKHTGQMIVGTGCMKADEVELGNRIRSILAAQKTLRKQAGIVKKNEALHADCDRIRAQVEAMSLPPIFYTSWHRAFGILASGFRNEGRNFRLWYGRGARDVWRITPSHQ